MKKYLQLIVVTAAFVALAAWRNGHPDDQPIVSTRTAPQPTSQQSVGPTPGGSSANTSTNSAPVSAGGYKDGTYTGSVEDAFYGFVQVRATVSGGKLASVNFLSYPNHNYTSISINQQAMPMLEQEAIQSQSAQVDGVSGASDTSMAFTQSLATALGQASK